jgi:cell division septum initiation protein DivIVA
MTTTDMQHEASQAASEDASGGKPPASPMPTTSDPASELLAKARYEAFRLVTEARQEAEEILDEARAEAASIRKDAEVQAESIVDAAHVRSKEIIDSSEPDADTHAAEAVANLEHEHEALTQRVSSLRTLADQLEERFAALAATANATHPTIEEPPRPVLDYSPSVPHRVVADPVDDGGPSEPEPERGSFYSRRSAKLPRIGDAGGKDALDMMRSLRESFDDE